MCNNRGFLGVVVLGVLLLGMNARNERTTSPLVRSITTIISQHTVRVVGNNAPCLEYYI